MKYHEIFPSPWLKADDLDGKDLTVTIEDVERREFKDGDKPVVEFKEVDGKLILNRTNFRTIVGLYDDDTDLWPGKQITLSPTMVDYCGKQTLGIRVRPSVPGISDKDKGQQGELSPPGPGAGSLNARDRARIDSFDSLVGQERIRRFERVNGELVEIVGEEHENASAA